MKTTLSLIALLALSGCSLNDTQTYEQNETVPYSVSNIGNNISSLGYYEDNTTFGHTEIDGLSTLYMFEDDNVTINTGNVMHFKYEEDNVYRHNGSEYMLFANYGVSEDGMALFWFTGMDVELSYLYQVNDGCDAISDGVTQYMLCAMEGL